MTGLKIRLREHKLLFMKEELSWHSDLTTTTRRYAYLIDELRQKADDDIENILNNVGIETSHRIAE